VFTFRRTERRSDASCSARAEQLSEDFAGAGTGTGILRPIFELGDALPFDEVFLRKTGSDPSMLKPRFSIENRLFGPPGHPADYAPLPV